MFLSPRTRRVRAFGPACGFFLAVALFLVLPSASLFAAGTLSITIIDVGQGDATLIESPSGQTLLFDAGSNGDGDDTVVPYVHSRGFSSLDYLAASHYHADHIGGLDEVYSAMRINEAVLDRGWDYSTLTYNSYASTVASQRQTLTPGQVVDLGEGVTVTCVALNSNGVLNSPYTTDGYENEYNVCLLVQYGNFDFFVGGDLTGGGLGEEDIETGVAPLVGDVDIYRVNHHGSDTSSNAAFLQTLQAEVAMISVGSNSYGHPTQAVLNRLVTYGSFVYQTEAGSGGTLPATDLTVAGGHILITTDGVSTYDIDGDVWQLDEVSPVPPLAFGSDRLILAGNAPNPFNPATEIRFSTDTGGPSLFEVYDLAGHRVSSHAFTSLAGENSLDWRGRNGEGRLVAGGVYLYTVSTPDGTGRGRMLLLK